jgi:CDP-glucose 4,6-dehydratase
MMAVNSTFWRDKKVLVTGHTGFKGSWLSLWLQSMEAEVTGYSLSVPTEPSFFELARVAEGMESITGDVRDLEQLHQVIADRRPEIIIHMAAQSLVRRSYVDPVETYATNVMGTVNLLEAIRRTDSVKAALVVTSDKCYENREWVWGYRENDPMGGYDPYSSSKGCAELVTTAFQRSYFNPAEMARHGVGLASARAGNVIGGGDWAEDRLIPDFIRSMLEGRPVAIRNPHAIRPWQHVLDPLSGYMLLAEKLYEDGARYAESWNFGPRDEDARPVSWIVERMVSLWGDGASSTFDRGENPHEAHHLKLDCSKARGALGWRPQWNIEKALEATVVWYKAYRSEKSLRSLSLEQIESYQKGAGQEALR